MLKLMQMEAYCRPAGRRSSPAASSSAWRWPALMTIQALLLDEPLSALDPFLKIRMAPS